MDLDKAHQGVDRLIKVYVAYLKTLPCCVVMLSAVVSEGREGEATLRKKAEVEGYVWNVRFFADKLDPSVTY